jgi:hypothetical protein
MPKPLKLALCPLSPTYPPPHPTPPHQHPSILPLEQEKEVEGRRASLSKWKLELIHRAMDALDLQRGSGDKVGGGWAVQLAGWAVQQVAEV